MPAMTSGCREKAGLCPLKLFILAFVLGGGRAMTAARRKLKRTALPSEALPVSSTFDKENDARKKKKKMLRAEHSAARTDAKQNQMYRHPTEQHEQAPEVQEEDEPTLHRDRQETTALMETLEACAGARLCEDKCLQVTSEDFGFRFSDLIKKDNVRALLGMPTIVLLDILSASLERKTPSKTMFCARDRIVIAMLVLKHSLSFTFLSHVFRCSPTTCGAIVNYALQALAVFLRCAVPWPTEEEILNNLPVCFQSFPNVRVVLDCTEIPVVLPKCLKRALYTYSFYKSTQTVKYMIGVSTAGMVTYVSNGYGGRSSDKVIFQQSGLVRSLTPGVDQIMVDKGFLIEDICSEHSIKLLRPQFLRSNQQFLTEEALETRQIAADRVHVERAIQRIKLFKNFVW